jgi:hypothetical protein
MRPAIQPLRRTSGRTESNRPGISGDGRATASAAPSGSRDMAFALRGAPCGDGPRPWAALGGYHEDDRTHREQANARAPMARRVPTGHALRILERGRSTESTESVGIRSHRRSDIQISRVAGTIGPSL